MEPHQIKSFTKQYLSAYNCEICTEASAALTTRLSVEVDKELMNRPFYWMYVDKMGLSPQPATLTFSFDGSIPEGHVRAEYLFYGSPRFSKMLSAAQQPHPFVRLYEDTKVGENHIHSPSHSLPYLPYLGINYKVSYVCDQKKEELYTLGVNLHSGQLESEFYARIKDRKWSGKLPPYRHTITPQLTLLQGVGLLEQYIETHIQEQQHPWASEAQNWLEQELLQLERYYEGVSEDNEKHAEKSQRVRDAFRQYHPRIEVSIVNAGLFYLEIDQ
ncbi:YqhG family protein [Mechercharimyces sp. CAU 1602]|uniref:YqhG family protein n=1 Tax=Mechercharimyces sp. CAU 1602 TaxID=2973933 RepID=UPI0021634019|nr:YqhG family protein [Mechercharimyces sp. CAU 1602]MCS1350711.1 YqhG family protein [Mechercharimyces sp. CAU 1602]